MSKSFDALHKWLGIPPAEQPPHHYRLLGIAVFEADADVIESAADQRMTHIRSFQTGKYSAQSQRLLNELSAAKLCLLDADRKAAYDDTLRLRFDAAEPLHAAVPVAIEMPQAAVGITTAGPIPLVVDPPVRNARRGRSVSSQRLAWLILAAVAAPSCLWIGYMIVQTRAARASAARKAETITVAKASTPEQGPPPATSKTAPAVKPPTLEEKQPPVSAPSQPNETVATSADSSKRFPFEIPDPRRARWSIEGDELVQSTYRPWTGCMPILFGDADWQDFDFSAEVKRDVGNDACGLLFRHENGLSADEFWLSSFGNRVHRVQTLDQGRVSQPAAIQGSLDLGRWYGVEVRVRGKSGECFLDGKPIASFELQRLRRGRLGLATWDSAYRFRNILVKSPEGNVLLEGLPDLDAEPLADDDTTRQQQMISREGMLPTTTDGRPLNFDFETGDLRDWTAEGDAFKGQPIEGDALHAGYRYVRSEHAGQFWVGGNEKTRNTAKGTLTSVPFKVTHPYASFLLGGAMVQECSVELFLRGSETPFFRAVGCWNDALQPVAVDLTEYVGKEIFIRLNDRDDQDWGHVNFDDLRFHETKPDFSPRYASSPDLVPGSTVDVLKLIDPDRDVRVGQGHWDEQHQFVLPGTWMRAAQLPLPVPKEYDLALTVAGVPRVDDVFVILPIAERQVHLILDGWRRSGSGLQMIDGKFANGGDPAQKTSTHGGAILLDGQPNKLVCQVRSDSIKVLCNGATVIDWQGDPKRLSLQWGKVAGWDGIVIGVVGFGAVFSQIDLTPVAPDDSKTKPVKPSPSGVAKSPPPKGDAGTPQPTLTVTEASSLRQHTAAVTRVAYHQTLPILASAGKDGQVLLWDLQNVGQQRQIHKFAEEVWTVKFSPDGKNIAFANRYWWGSRLVFKTVAGLPLNELKDFKHGGGSVASIAYSHDGRFLAAGQDDGTFRVWDVVQFREVLAVGLGDHHNVFNLAFGPVTLDKKKRPIAYLLAEFGHDGIVRTFAGTSGTDGQWSFRQTEVQFPKGVGGAGLRFSPKGNALGITRIDGTISLLNPQTGMTIRDLARGGGVVEWIAFHPQKPWCVTAHKDAQVARIWNIDTGEMLCELKGHTGGVMCAEFSPDGRHVATASEDFSIKLWDLGGPGLPATEKKKGKKSKAVLPIVGN
ncbi:MAG TPA: hypothetical protein VHC22_12845 [Pirellulales bacterium]|nr:hypothetical protein [Pirellulales bacterium]